MKMAEMRDLKADLKLCNKATPGPWIDNGNEIVVPSNPNEGIAGALTDEDNAFISQAREGWPHAIERAIKAESLARELAEVLLLYEKWEADLLMDNSLWQSASGLPFITQEVWDELVAVQTERNKVLHKVKEVLGDE